MADVFFSVIMPCYKTATDSVRRAINSVIHQSFSDWELIFVDDNKEGSSFKEMSYKLSNLYAQENRIHFLFHEGNMGANAARNTAINASSGEWLAFLDADDYWDEGYLLNVYECIGTTSCSLVSSPIRISDGSRVREMPVKRSSSGYYFQQELMGDIFSPSSGICVSKEVLLKAGGFDESLPARQDYDMWIRVCRDHEVAFCNQIAVTVLRDGHESISTDYRKHLAGTEAIIQKIKSDALIDDDLRKRALRSQYLYLARFLAINGQKRLAKKYLTLIDSRVDLKLRLIVAVSFAMPYIRRVSRLFRYKKKY